MNDVWIYKGELDLDGKMCGFGKYYNEKHQSIIIEGTFMDDVRHGLAVIKFVEEGFLID